MYFLLFVALIINLGYWVFIFNRLSVYKDATDSASVTGKVLVVMAVRNEKDNLTRYLPRILNQDHPDFRVLVIDDHSTDGTQELLKDLQKSYPHLEWIVHQGPAGKKSAIHLALQDRTEDFLLFTDGDCQVSSERWIRMMTGKLKGAKEIVLGYGPFVRSGSWLNLFARFENFMTALQYFSWTLAGMPYMGVGRNLAYTRERYMTMGGFSSHLHIVSGDDDLFINRAANAGNVAIQTDSDSFVYSEAKATLRGFFRQKRRHISTSVYYQGKHQTVLGLYVLSHLAFYVFLFLCPWTIALGAWILRILVILIIHERAFRNLKQEDLIPYFPVLDFMMFFYYLILGFYSLIPHDKKWK